MRGEFGYWVFEGDTVPVQRPSWNYRKEDGGGIILDMLCHWRYVLDNLFGSVKAVSCLGATHIPQRWDEAGKPYECTADDSAYATFELEGGVIAHFNSSWCVRVRRDDLLTCRWTAPRVRAVAGLRDCWIQPYGATPRPVWNPDIDSPLNYFDGWQKVPEQTHFRQRLQAPVGAVPPPRRERRARSAGTCSKAPKACSSPKRAWSPGRNALGGRAGIESIGCTSTRRSNT